MTLIELMTVSVISAFLVMGLVGSVLLTNTAHYEYKTQIKLNNDARKAVDRMVWGRRDAGAANRRGISEAVSAVVNPAQIDYTDINAVVHSFRQNGGNIQYRNGAAGAWQTVFQHDPNAAFDATQQSTNLSFTQNNPNAVQINLVLGQRVQGRWHYASFSTQVAFRNV